MEWDGDFVFVLLCEGSLWYNMFLGRLYYTLIKINLCDGNFKGI